MKIKEVRTILMDTSDPAHVLAEKVKIHDGLKFTKDDYISNLFVSLARDGRLDIVDDLIEKHQVNVSQKDYLSVSGNSAREKILNVFVKNEVKRYCSLSPQLKQDYHDEARIRIDYSLRVLDKIPLPLKGRTYICIPLSLISAINLDDVNKPLFESVMNHYYGDYLDPKRRYSENFIHRFSEKEYSFYQLTIDTNSTTMLDLTFEFFSVADIELNRCSSNNWEYVVYDLQHAHQSFQPSAIHPSFESWFMCVLEKDYAKNPESLNHWWSFLMTPLNLNKDHVGGSRMLVKGVEFKPSFNVIAETLLEFTMKKGVNYDAVMLYGMEAENNTIIQKEVEPCGEGCVSLRQLMALESAVRPNLLLKWLNREVIEKNLIADSKVVPSRF